MRGPQTEEHKQKIRDALMGHLVTSDTRQKIGKRSKGRTHSDGARQKMRDSHLGQIFSEDTKQKMSEKRTQAWQRDEYVQAQMIARGMRPNQLELEMVELIEPLGFKYVGDGQLIIAGKCPDFWDGNAKLIELYGDYWHRNDDPQDRIDLFKTAGYDCLVIWEREFRESPTRVRDMVLQW